MILGTVRYFDRRGKYGFINVDDSSESDEDEVFVHMDDVGGPDLEEGQNVEFDIEEAEKGPRAVDLTRLNADGEPEPVPEEGEDEAGLRDDGVIVDEDGNRWVSINDM